MQFGNRAEIIESTPKNDLEARSYRQFQKAAAVAYKVFPNASAYVLVDGECFRLCAREGSRIGLVSLMAQAIFVYTAEMIPHAERLAEQYKKDLKREFRIIQEYTAQ